MPVPKPRENENEDAFIERYMSNDAMKEEFEDNKQRFAVCRRSWAEEKESKNKFWNFSRPNDNEGELFIYGEITSEVFFEDDVSPRKFKSELDDLGDIGKLNIYINSSGGDVFAGNSIYNMLKRHKAIKTVYVDGVAASIASVIAMVGDDIIMPMNSLLMIHNPWTMVMGNSNDFRKIAEDLDKIRETIISTYQSRSILSRDEIITLMNDETWLTALEAYDYGFATQYKKDRTIAASINKDFINFGNVKVQINDKNINKISTNNVKETNTISKDILNIDQQGNVDPLYLKQLLMNRRTINNV